MRMRVLVEHEKCCGAGQCVMVAPKVFDQRDDGIVVLLDEAPPPEQYRAVREAVSICPGAALRLEESA
ncbi:ferredoxin [Sorangium cellulosum]|uniref:Ferredoxin n=2 Tax=Sorangium cellulosum TaxID=56 RepID=A0A2L0EWD1_SORCE|nr:ferredoxin [Sorangium cellulosum]